MHHRILCVLTSSLATASLAVAPAFATDDSPGAPLQPAPPLSALGGVLGKCTDSAKPSSGFTAKAARAVSKSHVLRGTARDVGCGVAMVTISVARQHGKRCEYLATNRRLSKPTHCSGHWLVAAGTKSWHLSLPKHLPRGTYLVRTRAIDFAGNVQRVRTGKHVQRLRLR
jgi:hypothetical protein